MAQFVVESYHTEATGEPLARIVARARAAAAAMRGDGVAVRYLRTIQLPEDEICFHLVEGPSAAAVGELTRRAAMRHERIAAADVFPHPTPGAARRPTE